MEKIERAGHILSSYVTHGGMNADDQFDEDFRELAELVPEGQRRTPAAAMRVITIPAAEYERIRLGHSLSLRRRLYGSWTRDEHAARLLLRGRCARADDDSMTLIIRKDLDPGTCIVDVEALYRELGWNCGDVHEFGLYVEWEKEIIIRQNDRLCTVDPGDVVAAHPSRDSEACRPYEGETVWLPVEENFIQILEVLEDQPYNENGLWIVVSAEGEIAIRYDHGNSCWEQDELPVAVSSPTP